MSHVQGDPELFRGVGDQAAQDLGRNVGPGFFEDFDQDLCHRAGDLEGRVLSQIHALDGSWPAIAQKMANLGGLRRALHPFDDR